MKANVFIVEMSACLPNQSIALKNGVGDIAAMAKSSFVHTPKNKRYDESGLVAAEKIKKTMPQIKVIIVTSLVECSFIDRARKAGVESFWYKDAGKEELLEVMDRTMKGESVYPDTPPVVMIGTAKSCDFTPGELAVLRLVVEGESYKKIAESLCISPETVKWHIKNMLQKTNFDSKTKLAVAVTKKNLIINGF